MQYFTPKWKKSLGNQHSYLENSKAPTIAKAEKVLHGLSESFQFHNIHCQSVHGWSSLCFLLFCSPLLFCNTWQRQEENNRLLKLPVPIPFSLDYRHSGRFLTENCKNWFALEANALIYTQKQWVNLNLYQDYYTLLTTFVNITIWAVSAMDWDTHPSRFSSA